MASRPRRGMGPLRNEVFKQRPVGLSGDGTGRNCAAQFLLSSCSIPSFWREGRAAHSGWVRTGRGSCHLLAPAGTSWQRPSSLALDWWCGHRAPDSWQPLTLHRMRPSSQPPLVPGKAPPVHTPAHLGTTTIHPGEWMAHNARRARSAVQCSAMARDGGERGLS